MIEVSMFLQNVIILSYISSVHVLSLPPAFNSVSEAVKKGKLSAEQIVQFMVSNHFQDCDAIFFEDSNTGIFLQIQIFNLIPHLSIRYSLLFDSHTARFSSSRLTIPIRKYSQCFVIVSVMNKGNTYLSKLGDILFKGFGAPTQADQDYYIFITGKKHVNSILNSSTSKLIKYKLAIAANSRNSHSIVGFSLCFYCGTNGAKDLDHQTKSCSQVVTIDLVNAILSLESLFPDFTLNGNGYAMKTTSPIKYKFTTEIQEISPGKWQLVRGISKSIMDNVLPHYNFTYVVFSSPSGDTGGPIDKNSTVWNGCIGQLIAGEAELSLTTSANHARFLVITFSTAAFYVWVSFTVGKSKTAVYSWKAIFWPFTKELWLAVITSLFAVIFVFKAFKKFDTQRGFNGDFRDYRNSIISRGKTRWYKNFVSEITFSLIGKSVQDPDVIYSRVLLSVWLLAGLVINTLYTSKIVGLLAQPIYENSPRTFEDLADSKFSIGMDHSGGSLFAYFQTSSSPIFQKMFSKFEEPKDTVACFEAAKQSKFACITWNGVADYVGWSNFTIVDGQSPLLRATDVTYFTWSGLAMPRNAVFKPNFDKTMSMIYDTGHGNRWIINDLEELQRNFLRWQRQELNQTIVRYGDNGPVMLKLSNILGVFYIFGVGHSIAVLGFSAEKVLSFTAAKNLMMSFL